MIISALDTSVEGQGKLDVIFNVKKVTFEDNPGASGWKKVCPKETAERKKTTTKAEQKQVATKKRKTKPKKKVQKSSMLYAVLSCEHSNRHTNIASCFLGSAKTEIKLTNKGRKRIIRAWELNGLGREYSDGLHFELSRKFSFRAQNSSDMLSLRLVIRDKSPDGKIMFEDVVGEYGTIRVRQ